MKAVLVNREVNTRYGYELLAVNGVPITFKRLPDTEGQSPREKRKQEKRERASAIIRDRQSRERSIEL